MKSKSETRSNKFVIKKLKRTRIDDIIKHPDSEALKRFKRRAYTKAGDSVDREAAGEREEERVSQKISDSEKESGQNRRINE